jgi:GxxExxY protein
VIESVYRRPEETSSSTKNTKEHKEGHIIADLILKDEVYAIIGAAIEVHRETGPGFLEPVYQEAMEIELRLRSIPFASQQHLVISYKGHRLQRQYIADLVCFEQVIVELKALDRPSGKDEAQILNYLKATGLRVGLLINSGHFGRLEWKRFVN